MIKTNFSNLSTHVPSHFLNKLPSAMPSLESHGIIKTSLFHDLPDISSESFLHNLSSTLAKPNLLVNTVKIPSLHDLLHFQAPTKTHADLIFPVNKGTENSSFAKESFELLLKKGLEFILEEGYGIYSDVRDGLKEFNKQQEESGSSLNHRFINTSASEYFWGGFGDDTVVYSGARENYHVEKTISGYTVSGITSHETDTLFSIEHLEFSNASVNLIGSLGIGHLPY